MELGVFHATSFYIVTYGYLGGFSWAFGIAFAKWLLLKFLFEV